MSKDRENPSGAGTDARKRKDGRYETRATLDTPTGRWQVSFYGRTAKEANDAKFTALADQAKGVLFSDPQRRTVSEYLDKAQGCLGYARAALKARKLEEGMHPNTVGVVQGVLSAALNQAVYDGLIPANPCSRVKKAAARGQRPMRAPSEVEASDPVRVAEGSREEALIVTALRTGMRQGELAALRWEDVDLDGARPSIRVRRSADTRTKTVITPTKTGEERTVGIGPRTIETLRRHRARQLRGWPRRAGTMRAGSSPTRPVRSAGATP